MFGRKTALVSIAPIVGLLASCGGNTHNDSITDSGAPATSPSEVRRALRSTPLALAPSSHKVTPLAFTSSDKPPTFAPITQPNHVQLDLPAAKASGRSTFSLTVPITPLPNSPGRFVLRRQDSAAFFTSTGFALSLAGGTNDERRGWGLHATLAGAREVTPLAERAQQSAVNHYVGAASKWQTDIPTYGQLAWEEVYPGIDMVVEPSRGGFTYRFVVSPGAKPEQIAFDWSGASELRAVDDGRGLEIGTGIGALHVSGLRAFVIEGQQRRELPVRHVVEGSRVSMAVEGWSGAAPLVIDPTVSWSSFLGGSGLAAPYGIATDGSGNAVVVGYTSSADFPIVGAFDSTLSTDEGFVTKISGTGALIWSSFLGGTSSDRAHAVAVDGSSNIFVAGETASTDFATSGGFDTALGGSRDAFVTKISASGALLWSTYLGGSGQESVKAIAADGSGNVFMTGSVRSTDFPSSGGFDSTLGGTTDAFVTKMSGSGALLWSSYLGGSAYDQGFGIACDGAGNAIVVGGTQSTDLPTSGAFAATLAGGDDAFVAKISGSGALLWSSYLGGTANDSAYAVATDSSGSAFVVGYASAGFPTTGGFRTTGYSGEAFVTKIDSAGALSWSSFLGGNSIETARGVAVDMSGDVYVTGDTQSTDFATSDAFDTTLGSQDAFIAKITNSGLLRWVSLMGGTYTCLLYTSRCV